MAKVGHYCKRGTAKEGTGPDTSEGEGKTADDCSNPQRAFVSLTTSEGCIEKELIFCSGFFLVQIEAQVVPSCSYIHTYGMHAYRAFS